MKVLESKYKSTWTEEVRYKKNDIVKRGGNLMKCLVDTLQQQVALEDSQADYALKQMDNLSTEAEYENVWAGKCCIPYR